MISVCYHLFLLILIADTPPAPFLPNDSLILCPLEINCKKMKVGSTRFRLRRESINSAMSIIQIGVVAMLSAMW